MTAQSDCSAANSCHFRRLLRSRALEVGVFHCCGSPNRSAAEAAPYPEIVIPQSGAYIRRDATGSVYLDETVIGFFEAGKPYVIEHVRPRPDVTTVISLRRQPAPAFARSAIRATAAIHMAHKSLLQQLVGESAESLAAEELAAWLVLLALDRAGMASDLNRPHTDNDDFSGDILVAVNEFIRQHYRRKLTLDEIACHAGYSVFHLCRLFRARMKLTIHQYITQLRLEAAHRALIETVAPVTAIALDYGFASHAHFSTRFIRWAGVSPSQARRLTPRGPWPGCVR